MPGAWKFYGRQVELEELTGIVSRGRWFFVKISGRRRIGKTTLVQQALARTTGRPVLYIQVPDSDPAGVVSAAHAFMETFQVPGDRPRSLQALAQNIGDLVRQGWVVALDEFQYFHRQSLWEFTSHLQAVVDGLAADAEGVTGGLIVLGSLHAEMAALLEDRSAPLFNRVTHTFELGHLDIGSIVAMLEDHTDPAPERLLFLWNLFEGVPKFYRDCHEQGVLGHERREVLERMFFSSSSPLRNEADNWFLKELRGRYDLVLKYIAGHPGCTNADILGHARSVAPEDEHQVGGYLKILRERFQMIERLQPVFARPTERNGRYYIRDNFLRSWLAAISHAAAAVNFRPLDVLVADADSRLREAEGHGLERLVRQLYEERSRRRIGDFPLTAQVRGFWDRRDTEIDVVAIQEDTRTIRLGTCKRSGERLPSDLARFDGHVGRFLAAFPDYRDWSVQKVAIAPALDPETRRTIEGRGYLAQDLRDLTAGLGAGSPDTARLGPRAGATGA
ncbi:MAG: ATP-binding protein [Deltaproteobacteria bacterium]|nr:ATP-binding protein [Deltaproteobacteria bacterium]